MSGRVFETTLRVRYVETDQMGVVYHSNFLIWFEVGRVEAMRELGFDYKDMEREDGCFIAVVDARCRYKSPAYYDEQILVRTKLANVRGSLIHFHYDIVRARDGTLLAEGETMHIVTDRNMQKREMPDKYRAAMTAAAEGA